MSCRDSSPQDREVGRRIKMRRRELGISQTVLGDTLNISYQQIQKYEKGTNRVGAGRLQHIASVLKVPISFFFDDLGGHDGGGSEISALLDTVYALRLLKAFSKVSDHRVQRRVVELVETIAGVTQTKVSSE